MNKIVGRFAVVTAMCGAATALTVMPASASAMNGMTVQSGQHGLQEHVILSPTAPGVIHHPDGSWIVPLNSMNSATEMDGGCRGTYIDPSIVARGNGTAVHFGVKYFCTEPVEYTVEAGVEDYYEEAPGGPVLGHLGADPVTRSGVSQQPFADGYSYPCRNNQNSGWEPYDFSTVHGQHHNGNGTRVTVGCRV